MTQATNCGSTPAALNNIQDLTAVTGACGLKQTTPADSTSSMLVPSSAPEGADAGAVPTAKAGSQASGTGTSNTPASTAGSSGHFQMETGLMWGLAVAAAVHLFT